MHAHDFAGERFLFSGERALFWPAQGALLVADLHLEKGSSLARGGQMLPPYDSAATLARLSSLAERCAARTIWCLGDNFHDPEGLSRLPGAERQQLDRLATRHGLKWIVGNHDGHAALPGDMHDEWRCGPIVLRHEARPRIAAGDAEISGHFHPKIRVAAGPLTVRRPCFVLGRQRMILPAFGAYTGGLDAGAAPIRQRLGDEARAIVVTESCLVHIPITRQAVERRARGAGFAVRPM